MAEDHGEAKEGLEQEPEQEEQEEEGFKTLATARFADLDGWRSPGGRTEHVPYKTPKQRMEGRGKAESRKQSKASRNSKASKGSRKSGTSYGSSASLPSSSSGTASTGSSSSGSESSGSEQGGKKGGRKVMGSQASLEPVGRSRSKRSSERSNRSGRSGSSRGTKSTKSSYASSIASTFKGWARKACIKLQATCRKRSKAAAKASKEAVVREFQAGIGKTHTAKQIRILRKKSGKQIKRDLKEYIQKLVERAVGSGQTTDPRKQRKKGRKSAWKSDVENPGGFGSWTFVIHNPGTISDYYVFGDEIGCGGSSKVFRAKEKMTGVQRAVKKIFKRDSRDAERIAQEVSTMKFIDHPNIVRLYETFEDERALYLVMELCAGNDVLDRLLSVDRFSEYQAAVMCRVCIMVMSYLSANNIVHRDIKAENVMFKDAMPDVALSNLRVVDFGFSARQQEGKTPEVEMDGEMTQVMYTPVGSTYYMAPEILKGTPYTNKCDLWSLGVLCFMLLSGKPPFLADTDAGTISKIKTGKFVFPKQEWYAVSKPAKHFIRRLLVVDPEERMPLKRAIIHPWIRNRGVVQMNRMREETVDTLLKYHFNHRLRKAALLAVAYQLDASSIRPLIELFHYMDTNGDGILTTEEFSNAVSACGIEQALIDQMMASVDSDNSGFIDFTELVGAMLEPSMYVRNHGAMLRAFRTFDQDDGGSLSMDEVAEVIDMNTDELREEVQTFFEMVDINGDGQMDYGEFFQMLARGVRDEDMNKDEDDLIVDEQEHQEIQIEGEDGEEEEKESDDESDGEEAAEEQPAAIREASPRTASPKGSPKGSPKVSARSGAASARPSQASGRSKKSSPRSPSQGTSRSKSTLSTRGRKDADGESDLSSEEEEASEESSQSH